MTPRDSQGPPGTALGGFFDAVFGIFRCLENGPKRCARVDFPPSGSNGRGLSSGRLLWRSVWHFSISGTWAKKMREGRFPPFGFKWKGVELWAASLMQFLAFFDFCKMGQKDARGSISPLDAFVRTMFGGPGTRGVSEENSRKGVAVLFQCAKHMMFHVYTPCAATGQFWTLNAHQPYPIGCEKR